LVVVGVRQQSQEAGALDSGAQLTLIAGLGTGQASRHDLGVFLDVFLQDFNILVVDLFDLFSREAAELATLEQAATALLFLVVILLLEESSHFRFLPNIRVYSHAVREPDFSDSWQRETLSL
jgi:hypothetical protein